MEKLKITIKRCSIRPHFTGVPKKEKKGFLRAAREKLHRRSKDIIQTLEDENHFESDVDESSNDSEILSVFQKCKSHSFISPNNLISPKNQTLNASFQYISPSIGDSFSDDKDDSSDEENALTNFFKKLE